MKVWFIPGTFVPLCIMKPKKNINTIIPDGKYFHKPPNKVHKDKSKFNRNQKHKKNEDQSDSI
jgi:hypothetical protein